jgi:hypothetical protein
VVQLRGLRTKLIAILTGRSSAPFGHPEAGGLQLPSFQEAEIVRPVENDVVEQIDANYRTSGFELCGDPYIAGRRFEAAAGVVVLC